MTVFSFDSETFLIAPGLQAPPPVCMSYVIDGGTPVLTHANTAVGGRMREVFGDYLVDSNVTLVGSHVGFDMRVCAAAWPEFLEDIFAAYEADRVVCIQLRQQLLDIAAGCFRGYQNAKGQWVDYQYNLEAFARRYTDVRYTGVDEWRLRYSELVDVPVDEWPEAARTYALADAYVTDETWRKQEEHKGVYLEDQYRQARYYWALGLASCWGIRTREDRVLRLETDVKVEYERLKSDLQSIGLVRADGSRDTKKAKHRIETACAALTPPRSPLLTEKGAPSLSAEACEWSGDEVLEDYAEYGSQVYTFAAIDMLKSGAVTPIHTRFDLVASGRTSSSKPNIQNPRRMPGIRECFVPRDGHVFICCDFDAFELRTLAQVCLKMLGASELAKALNAGKDPHTELAAVMLGTPYDEAVRRKEDPEDKEFDLARQTAKVANFGFPGGLGKSIIHFAKAQYNVVLEENTGTNRDWRVLKNLWLSKWPEMLDYFECIGSLADEDGYIQIDHLFSGRYRGGMFFTNACNTTFQGLAADAAKHCCWLVQKACYIIRSSPLYGSRLVNFVHDELITETPEDGAHEAALEQARIMVEGAGQWLPDVPPKCKPLLSRCWSKKAKALYGADGRLIPWDYKEVA